MGRRESRTSNGMVPRDKNLDWDNGETRQAAFQLDGKESRFYFIFNMDPEERDFVLPILPEDRAWLRVADTSPSGRRGFPGRRPRGSATPSLHVQGDSP